MKKYFSVKHFAAASMLLALAACSGTYDNPAGTPTGSLEPLVRSIPSDNGATPAPPILSPNITLPTSVTTTLTQEEGLQSGTVYNVAEIRMPGLQNPNTGDWLILSGTYQANQNVWITVDGQPKGFTVFNSMCTDAESPEPQPVDIIFLVDNSTSMGSVSDQVASEIIAWSKSFSSSIDAKFGCVGFGYSNAVTGAIDLTDATDLEAYLNRGSSYNRTRGFEPVSGALASAASSYFITSSMTECGALAARFANDNFTWRSGSKRIYINLTDTSNHPEGNSNYSVEWFNNPANWTTADNGEIHSVYIGYYGSSSWWDGTNNPTQINRYEDPGLMADYTGGSRTTFPNPGNFTLVSLPVTGTLQDYYLFRITNIEDLVNDGNSHLVVITIYDEDGQVQGEAYYNVKFE